MEDKKKVVKLDIETYTDDRGMGVFNFKSESKYKNNTHCIIKSNCYILRNNNNNRIEKYEDNISNDIENYDTLFRIRKSFLSNTFEIINPIRINMQKNKKNINNLNYYDSWYVIKSNNTFYNNSNEDYYLNENDIIKLGNQKYEIIKKNINTNLKEKNKKKLELNEKYNLSIINEKVGSIFDINLKSYQYIDNDTYQSIQEQNKSNSQNNAEDKKNEDKEINIKCIKCGFTDSEQNGNLTSSPLLKLCSCPYYIHYKCLKDKIAEKKSKHELNKNVIRYKYADFCCDKCKLQYPTRFSICKISDDIYELINLDIPSKETDFLILESLNYREDNAKILYIVKFDSKLEINIGRTDKDENGKINDFIDRDGSISSSHAVLKKDENGNIILEDKNSTYGTSVLIKGNIKLREENTNFQIGKSYISASLIDDIDDTLHKKKKIKIN